MRGNETERAEEPGLRGSERHADDTAERFPAVMHRSAAERIDERDKIADVILDRETGFKVEAGR